MNSETPINLNWFLPTGGVAGSSFFAGAFALLRTGSVALTSSQSPALASRRHPVTLTMSTGFAGAFWMSTAAAMRAAICIAAYHTAVRGAWWLTAIVVVALAAMPAHAHDPERTEVILTFARDGSFVLDVSNDPNWLRQRMEPFHGDFIDRVVLWVDGREVRPSSVNYVAPRSAESLATFRLTGRVSADARTLRWYYGLVVDPYPLTIRRADGRTMTETVLGDAWSRPIDLSGEFVSPLQARIEFQLPIVGLLALFALAIGARLRF